MLGRPNGEIPPSTGKRSSPQSRAWAMVLDHVAAAFTAPPACFSSGIASTIEEYGGVRGSSCRWSTKVLVRNRTRVTIDEQRSWRPYRTPARKWEITPQPSDCPFAVPELLGLTADYF